MQSPFVPNARSSADGAQWATVWATVRAESPLGAAGAASFGLLLGTVAQLSLASLNLSSAYLRAHARRRNRNRAMRDRASRDDSRQIVRMLHCR